MTTARRGGRWARRGQKPSENTLPVIAEPQNCDSLTVYEWTKRRGDGVISDWGLDPPLMLHLEEKIDRLRQKPQLIGEPSVAPGFGRGLYKLRSRKGRVQLRPIFCRGPIDNHSEITFLWADTERDGSLSKAKNEVQDEALQRADEIRQTPTRRKLYDDE